MILPLLPIALVLFMVFGRISQPLFASVQIKLSALNTILQENLAGIKVVKAFAREPFEEQRFDDAATALMAQQLRVGRIFALLFPLIFLIAQLGQAAILYFGGRQILDGTLNLGEYQKFSLYLVYVFFPLGQLGFIISLMAQAAHRPGASSRSWTPRARSSKSPARSSCRRSSGGSSSTTLPSATSAAASRCCAMSASSPSRARRSRCLGPPAAARSSIINLIPRFYDASEGAVLIDGHDVRDVTLDSLRSQIGIVLQETNLFSGTIRDNIAFGRPDATQEQVEAAARAASAHDFIVSFPQGYDTPVGERGATLSGGQKQRIAIARALLLDPRMLILDDSTSSVDLQTEYRIQQALDRLMQGRTSFVIAQRISTVLNADQILVLDRAGSWRAATTTTLMETSPIYAEIYTSQLVGDVDLAAMEASDGAAEGGIAI